MSALGLSLVVSVLACDDGKTEDAPPTVDATCEHAQSLWVTAEPEEAADEFFASERLRLCTSYFEDKKRRTPNLFEKEARCILAAKTNDDAKACRS